MAERDCRLLLLLLSKFSSHLVLISWPWPMSNYCSLSTLAAVYFSFFTLSSLDPRLLKPITSHGPWAAPKIGVPCVFCLIFYQTNRIVTRIRCECLSPFPFFGSWEWTWPNARNLDAIIKYQHGRFSRFFLIDWLLSPNHNRDDKNSFVDLKHKSVVFMSALFTIWPLATGMPGSSKSRIQL